MAILYPINWAGGTEQYTYLYNAWAACQFVNTTGAPITVTAVTIWCKGGTSGAYGFANTTNSTSGAVVSAASAPPTAYDLKTYTFNTPLQVAAGATFYAGIRGADASTPVVINGYQHSTGNAWYNGSAAGGALNSYPTMGGRAKRILGIQVVYELSYTDPTIDLSYTFSGTNVVLNWTSADGVNNVIQRYDLYYSEGTYVDGATYTYHVPSISQGHVITGLTPGATYAFRVYAVGQRTAGEDAFTATIPNAGAVSISGQKLTRDGATITATWQGNAGENNNIVGYICSIYNSAGVLYSEYAIGGASTSLSETVTRGDSYYFVITAHASYGESVSATTNTVEVPALSHASIELGQLVAGQNSVAVSYNIESIEDAYPVQSFRLYCCESSAEDYTNYVARSKELAPTSGSYVFPHLDWNGKYKVYAVFEDSMETRILSSDIVFTSALFQSSGVFMFVDGKWVECNESYVANESRWMPIANYTVVTINTEEGTSVVGEALAGEAIVGM